MGSGRVNPEPVSSTTSSPPGPACPVIPFILWLKGHPRQRAELQERRLKSHGQDVTVSEQTPRCKPITHQTGGSKVEQKEWIQEALLKRRIKVCLP
ncbi:uncharacterized protein ANIA_11346 [Aspergillus nidulans FGSC A4]|uniref:Uncharacterized protein n=1 Tax=Emericella nidulans (strain FGSC A4 / ATCC 38163 / CBS 112.46 / NRRL 194 / M139) TaxID=227321 RepID=C8VPH6_EMENI|nr:hypothetical protein [Aspergillus nidulans FGSC A4]CBF86976.1 TPA: hypothetical protein ANIA_11346 [Aspergillus nidulans FGSC A4]